jgi:hypothetical protein
MVTILSLYRTGASRLCVGSPNECDKDFSRLQEEKIFGQRIKGNWIETSALLAPFANLPVL